MSPEGTVSLLQITAMRRRASRESRVRLAARSSGDTGAVWLQARQIPHLQCVATDQRVAPGALDSEGGCYYFVHHGPGCR